MDAVEIAPAIVYATKKTGLLFTAETEHMLPASDLKEWDEAIDEFETFGGDPFSNPEEVGFDEILDLLIEEIETLIFLCGFCIDKYFNNEEILPLDIPDGGEYLSPEQYIGFCVARTQRSLRSIRHLIVDDMTDDALKLTRTIYENYLHIAYIQKCPEKIVDIVDAKFGLRNGTCQYLKVNGRTDKRIIENIKTGARYQSLISGYKMADALGDEFETEFYDRFYSMTSDVLHPNAMSLKEYIRHEGLSPLDSDWKEEAIIYCVFIGCLIADKLRCMRNFPATLDADCSTVINRISGLLLDSMTYFQIWQERIGIESPEVRLVISKCKEFNPNYAR